jgi:hypothetical protein
VHYQFAGERIGPTIPCKHIFLRSRGRKTVTLAAARAHHAMAAARVTMPSPRQIVNAPHEAAR